MRWRCVECDRVYRAASRQEVCPRCGIAGAMLRETEPSGFSLENMREKLFEYTINHGGSYA